MGKSMKCRNLTSHACVGIACTLHALSHIRAFFCAFHGVYCQQRHNPPNDLCTFWVPRESSGFVKQVVLRKVCVKLKTELSARIICFNGKSKDIFPYKLCGGQ